MVKNEKGVTLMILVVTIIVIIILAGVVMSINMNLNKSVELKEVLANMEMIRTAAAPYRDKYIGDTVEETKEGESTVYHISNKFIGEHLDPKDNEIMSSLLNYSSKDTITEDAHYWFKLDKEALEKLNINLETTKTGKNGEDEEDIYLINYSKLEVGYCKNKKDDRGYYVGIKVRKRFGNRNDPIKEKYVYFYEDLRDVKTREVRK